MNIVLLGSNSQLGCDLRKTLPEFPKDWKLIPVDRPLLDLEKLERIESVLEEYPIDCLIHCAAYHRVDEVEQNPQKAYRLNAHAVGVLAEVCKQKGAFFIHFSTDYVFDGSAVKPYTEEELPLPLNVYGASKALGEVYALAAWEKTTILRTASLFGVANSRGKGKNFVEKMIESAKQETGIKVVDDLIHSPTSTRDLARMIWSLLMKKGEPGIYHAVNSGMTSWFQFARTIFDYLQWKGEIIPVASDDCLGGARRPKFSALDNSKLASVIGPIPSWKEALKEYLCERGCV